MEVIPIKVRVVGLFEMFLQGREARCEGAGVQDTDAFAFEKSKASSSGSNSPSLG